MIDRIEQLLFRAEFFIVSHDRLRSEVIDKMKNLGKKVDYSNHPLANFTIMNANLYFFEAVSCIASLLRDIQSDPTKNEISFHMLAKKVPVTLRDSFNKELNIIFERYKSSELKDMRNKYIDHKDIISSGDPSAAFINVLRQEYVNSCSCLIHKLKQLYQKYFPDGTANNYFSDFYSQGVDEYIRLVSESLPD